jgi:D-tyrosyl-tRNA(Tyr) deacylase
MRAVVQRVTRASVSVEGTLIAAIDVGVLVLLGVAATDRPEDADRLAGRIARLRIFPDDAGRFDRSVLDVTGEALVVSQFTLIADSERQKGTRPDFHRAARPEVAEPIYLAFCDALGELGVSVQRGAFGALMTVELVNDGPVTIVLDAGELP